MSRGKAIQVKIPTAKVIKALETKLAQTKANYAKQDENEAKYQKEKRLGRKNLASGLLLISQSLKTYAPTIVPTTKL